MTPRARGNLRLGSSTVELLIPHRRPLLMVDGVDAFHREGPARLTAHRSISINEPWFAGHFPELPIWPGALTMEGLGQSGVLLHVLSTLCAEAEAQGEDAETVLEALRNVDRGFRLHPGHRPDDAAEVLALLRGGPREMALGAAVDLKFVAPVFPGCRLDYDVELTEHLGDRVRFAVEASVEAQTVARGTVTGALVPRPLVLDPPS